MLFVPKIESLIFVPSNLLSYYWHLLVPRDVWYNRESDWYSSWPPRAWNIFPCLSSNAIKPALRRRFQAISANGWEQKIDNVYENINPWKRKGPCCFSSYRNCTLSMVLCVCVTLVNSLCRTISATCVLVFVYELHFAIGKTKTLLLMSFGKIWHSKYDYIWHSNFVD